MQQYDIVVIGGGIAGLAAAISAKEHYEGKILILERENQLGGILNQCIHNGFGKNIFSEDLTGPEFVQKFIDKVKKLNISYELNTTVLNLNGAKEINAVNSEGGILKIEAKAIIIATGCRERPRGFSNLPGSRCAGIYTVGCAQKFINIEGYMPGKEIVILGTGDIALIVARRLLIEGAKVKAVVESKNFIDAVDKKLGTSLNDFNIPLRLRHKVVDIQGKSRIEGITLVKLNTNNEVIKGSEEHISCDALLLSVDLYPDNELAKQAKILVNSSTGQIELNEDSQTNISGIFACGGVAQGYSFSENVVKQSYTIGKSASLCAKKMRFSLLTFLSRLYEASKKLLVYSNGFLF